ncbi:hypothetical protein SGRA_0659 [Saprospira grandis str. Lewin]|uniref:Uncharacterized protein n=2 Tax=Saprospira TaxID=1007 RepID=H6L0G8_SAPGL|nr:hypothetical protein SGRA_0659 [Saprospira grandis str. Lewin]
MKCINLKKEDQVLELEEEGKQQFLVYCSYCHIPRLRHVDFEFYIKKFPENKVLAIELEKCMNNNVHLDSKVRDLGGDSITLNLNAIAAYLLKKDKTNILH